MSAGPADPPEGTNPFVPPGHERCPTLPLDPRRHGDLYLDVAGHAAGYTGFGRALEDAAAQLGAEGVFGALRERGRLIVVEGPEGSGKTTLIRRCAHELTTRAASAGTPLCTVDAPATREPGLSVEEQARAVCHQVLTDAEGFLPQTVLDRAAAKLAADLSPGHAYSVLSHALGVKQVIQVVTPPVAHDKSPDNVDYYQRWMVQGMIFYTEHTPSGLRDPLTVTAPSDRADPMLVLSLDALAPRDARTILVERTRAGRVPPGLPIIPEETITKLETDLQNTKYSVGRLIEVMQRVYARRLSRVSRYDAVRSVSYEELLATWGLDPGPGEQT